MSTDNDVARSLRSWLRENRHEDADRVLDVVFDQVPATPQHRPSWLVRRFPIMNNNFVRAALVAAAVVAAVIIGANLLPKQHVGPSPSVEPTASAVGGPPALNTLPTGDLAAGTYEIDAVFPARLTFTLPTGYGHGRGESDGVGIQYSAAGPQHGIEFQIASNVYPDPCHSAAGLADPPVGPSAQDLVTAMTTMVG